MKQTFKAITTRVVDGDTVYAVVTMDFFDTILSKTIEIRMVGIDAPETKGKEKPLGDVAKKWLKERIEGKTVTLELNGKDKYDRYLGVIFDENDVNVNDEMLKQKLVEVYSTEHHNDGILEV